MTTLIPATLLFTQLIKYTKAMYKNILNTWKDLWLIFDKIQLKLFKYQSYDHVQTLCLLEVKSTNLPHRK